MELRNSPLLRQLAELIAQYIMPTLSLTLRIKPDWLIVLWSWKYLSAQAFSPEGKVSSEVALHLLKSLLGGGFGQP